ncbi:hypothetical protein BCR42DRAFT_467444 [Absidia repens]|uniref:Kinesin motor domain-containing protein n=1 Tax=Absidia repens TaxID=90262 RepID=A0A1X2IC80_9FUNG|nr:hypothetical protein BCR42DRAFT_467444 [Absidia repens]
MTMTIPSPTLSLKDSHATAVQVAIRVRPLSQNEQNHSSSSHTPESNVIKAIGNTVTIVPHQKSFHFDHVFDTESAQDQVYTGVVSNLIDRFLDGYNVTILAYGQTSSGKTHTIMGSAGIDQEGIIPRAMSAFFGRLHSTISLSPSPSSSSSSSTSSQQSTSTLSFSNINPIFPPSPSSSYLRLPRSPVSPSKLRPLSTISTSATHKDYGGSNSSRRDSAPALLWRTSDKSPRSSVHVSFVEIYNEELVDLLNTSPSSERPPTAIREDTKGQIHWTGVKEVPVSKPEEVLRCLQIGTEARATGSTDMNTKSSRSHAIFTVTLKQEKWIPAAPSTSRSSDYSYKRETVISPVSSISSVVGMNGRPTSLKIKTRIGKLEEQQHYSSGKPSDEDGEWIVAHSKLHFVDLAGSERLKRTSAEGDRRKEGININAGLLALGNVISALASGSSSQFSNKKPTHVPYRDSKLTRMLQDSLGGNAVTLMIACISPAEQNLAETSNTIKYAHRARNIKNKVGRNEVEDWRTNDNPEFLRSLISQLKSNVKSLKSALLHHGTATDIDMNTQLQQKIWDCEQSVEFKQDQIIQILEQKLVGMAQVVKYLERKLGLQDAFINQLNDDSQEKTQQAQIMQRDLQEMLGGMVELRMERQKLNLVVDWLDKLKVHHVDQELESFVSFDELQQLYIADADNVADLHTVETLGTQAQEVSVLQENNAASAHQRMLELDNIKNTTVDVQQTEQNLDNGAPDTQKYAALESQLFELDQALEKTTKDRDNLNHILEYKQSELQTTELEQAQQQLGDTLAMVEQERKDSANDTSSLVTDLEDKLQVLQRARQLDQHEHDAQLDSVMDDLDKTQKAYEQQSHMVISLKQSLHNMQHRLEKASGSHLTATSHQDQRVDDTLQYHSQKSQSNSNSSKWNDDKMPTTTLQLRPSSSTPYPKSSASQTWLSSSNISAIADHIGSGPSILKPNIKDTSKTANITPEMKEQLQQFADKKTQLMMKILDMETQLRTQRSHFSSEMKVLESDLLECGTSNSRMERESKQTLTRQPAKLRSASSQPLICNRHSIPINNMSTAPSPSSHTTAQSPSHDLMMHQEIAPADDKVTKLQHTRTKRESSSSTATFLSIGTQTSSNISSNSSSTLQRSNSTHTAISTISSSQQSTETTANQYNKMLHTLQCKAQVDESNIHAHQDVIHKLERQLSRSETSVRDTKRQLEILQKEKQAYTVEIKNLRSQVTQIMTQQKMCLDESGERRKHLETALEQERRLKERAEKARLILENRMEILMSKKNKFMCF